MKRALVTLVVLGCNGKESPPPVAIAVAPAAVSDARSIDAVSPLGAEDIDAPADAALIDVSPEDTDVPQAPEQPRVFVPWEQRGAAKLWRGARNVRMTLEGSRDWSFDRQPIAMDVVGGRASIYDGARNMTFDFAITAPCIATATESFGKGGKNFHSMEFVVKNGVLHVGEGVVGIRRGKTAVVCGEVGSAQGVTIVDETGACTHWDDLGGWSQAKRRCAWSQDAGRDVLTIGTGDNAEVLIADGDVFMSNDFVQSEARFPRTKDFAEAKAAVTHELVWKDPVARAKAVGGVVGKTNTVASLIATNGAKNALAGKKVAVTGTLQRIAFFWADERTNHELTLVDANDPTGKVTIRCTGLSPPPAGIAEGDTVTASGTVDDGANLKKCSIAGSMHE